MHWFEVFDTEEQNHHPEESSEMYTKIWTGMAIAAVKQLFMSHSTDAKVKVIKKPESVVAKDKLATGSCKLIPLSRKVDTVTVLDGCNANPPKSNYLSNFLICKMCRNDKGTGDMFLCMKKDMQFAKTAASDRALISTTSDFVVPYWAVGQSADPSQINCEIQFKDIQIKLGKDTSYDVKVPMIVNTKPIAAGVPLMIAKFEQSKRKHEDDDDRDERSKSSRESTSGKSSKGKGKGKTSKGKRLE